MIEKRAVHHQLTLTFHHYIYYTHEYSINANFDAAMRLTTKKILCTKLRSSIMNMSPSTFFISDNIKTRVSFLRQTR